MGFDMIVYIGAFEARIYIDVKKKKVMSLYKKIEIDLERDSARLTAASIYHEIYEKQRIKLKNIKIIIDDSRCVLKKFDPGIGMESRDVFKIAQMEAQNLSVDTNKYHFINYEIVKNNFVEGVSNEYFNLAIAISKVFSTEDIEILSTYGLILSMFIDIERELEPRTDIIKLFNLVDRCVLYKKSDQNEINIFSFKDNTSARDFAKNLVNSDEYLETDIYAENNTNFYIEKNINLDIEDNTNYFTHIEEIEINPPKFISFILDKDNRKLIERLNHNRTDKNKGVSRVITAISIAVVIITSSLTFFEYQRYLNHKKSLEISQNANVRIKNRKSKTYDNNESNTEKSETFGNNKRNQRINIDDLLGVIDSARDTKIIKSTIDNGSMYLEGESKNGEDIEDLKNTKFLKNGYVERIEKVDKDRYKFIIVK